VILKVKYFVTKDTLGGEPRCAFANEVEISLLPKLLQMPKQTVICAKTSTPIGFQGLSGVSYNWIPNTFLSSSTIPVPGFLANTTDTADKVFPYLVTASHSASCLESDTVKINRLGRFAMAGNDQKICGADSVLISKNGNMNFNYSWFLITPNTGNFESNIFNSQAGATKIWARVLDSLPLEIKFRQIVLRQDFNCRNDDTVSVKLFPKPAAIELPALSLCPYESMAVQGPVSLLVKYQWPNTSFLSDSLLPLPIASGLEESQNIDSLVFRRKYWAEMPTCSIFDSIQIRFKKRPDIFKTSDKEICPGDSVSLGNGNVALSGYTYFWEPAQYLNNQSLQTVRFFAGSLENHNFTYYQTNTLEGCISRDTVSVQIKARPVFEAQNPLKVCSGIPIQIGPVPQISYQYTWQNPTGLSNIQLANPTLLLTYGNPQVGNLSYPIKTLDTITACNRFDTIWG
jgi:hypothetical protein